MSTYGRTYDVNLQVAEEEEQKGKWSSAAYYYKKCLALTEEWEPNNKQKLDFLNRKIRECESK